MGSQYLVRRPTAVLDPSRADLRVSAVVMFNNERRIYSVLE